jgi:hypothetical protein
MNMNLNQLLQTIDDEGLTLNHLKIRAKELNEN